MARPKRITRKPSYGFAVEWIADNDESACYDAAEIAMLASVVLIADLFGAEADDVASDVLRKRMKWDAEGRP